MSVKRARARRPADNTEAERDTANMLCFTHLSFQHVSARKPSNKDRGFPGNAARRANHAYSDIQSKMST